MSRIPWLSALTALSVCFAAGYGTHYLIEEVLPPLPAWAQKALIFAVVCVVGSILWAALWRAIRNQLESDG